MNRLLMMGRKRLVPGAVALYLPVEEGQNLLLYSQQFDNAAWPKVQATITPNAAVAPDGTMTADQLVEETLVNSYHGVYQNVALIQGNIYTGSAYVKKGTLATAPDIIQLFPGGTAFGTKAYVNFNLATGLVAKQGSMILSATMEAVTGAPGWYRCSFTAMCSRSGSNPGLFVAFCNNDPNAAFATAYIGAVTADMYVWGAQVREGTEPGEYYPTTDKQTLMDYSGRGNHGTLGSTAGADTNDPTWTGKGLSYDADDYVKFGPISDGTGTVQPMGAMVTAFYVPSPVSAASAKSCSFALAPNAAIYLGAVVGAPANNIITVQYDDADSYTSWCDAAATIAAGWHTLAVAWNGTTYDLYLDGAMLPTTTAGTPALLSPTAAFCCYDGTTYGPGIVRAARGIWARSLSAGELARARAYLKGYLAKFGVMLP